MRAGSESGFTITTSGASASSSAARGVAIISVSLESGPMSLRICRQRISAVRSSRLAANSSATTRAGRRARAERCSASASARRYNWPPERFLAGLTSAPASARPQRESTDSRAISVPPSSAATAGRRSRDSSAVRNFRAQGCALHTSRSSTLLPAPLGPTTAMIWPGLTVRSKSRYRLSGAGCSRPNMVATASAGSPAGGGI